MTINDHTHIQIEGGDILTVRGFERENIFAVPLYVVSASGDRILDGVRYAKALDEFAEHNRLTRPEWVCRTPYGWRVRVQKEKITRKFDPFSRFREIHDSLGKAVYRRVVDALTEFVPRKDVGFIGSSLVGFQSADPDLDIVVRGFANYRNLRARFVDFLSSVGARTTITKEQFDKSIVKYERLFNATCNDFAAMIYNRWPTVHIPGEIFCKIRFTFDPAVDDVFSAPAELAVQEGILEGEVVEDDGVAFMPRHFQLRARNGVIYAVITYYWDYSYCVIAGDEVTVKGAVNEGKKVMVIGDRKHHGIKFSTQKNIACVVI